MPETELDTTKTHHKKTHPSITTRADCEKEHNKKMENGWNLFNNDSSEGTRGHNGNCINFEWGGGEIWELGGNSRFDWNNSNQEITVASAGVASTTDDFMFSHLQGNHAHHQYHSSSSSSSIYVGSGGSNHHPDPHLTCLKLGKRHYFEDATPSGHRHVADLSIKKGEPYYAAGGGNDNLSYPSGPSSSEPVAVGTASPATVVVPKCRVDGCHVALVNTKEYHRRHKVCELHSKAPKVIVHGLEQRFCQQCSRFHVVSEFDEAKRSCRRRLAGHNQRRRKTSHEHSLVRNSSQGRALSLLSLKNNDSWTSLDLSSRCSAALQDLIAEHRAAAILTRQLLIDERESWQSHHNPLEEYDINRTTSGGSNAFLQLYHPNQILSDPQEVTLNLMHHDDPNLAYGFLSVKERSEKEEQDGEDCS